MKELSKLVNLETLDIMARTIWGEARNQGPDGMAAVAHTIINRAYKQSWYGKTFADVCLKPFQFSCWNEHDPNRDKILALQYDDCDLLICISAAALSLGGNVPDLTNGATHNHTTGVNPPWAKNKTPNCQIGDHLFYSGIDG